MLTGLILFGGGVAVGVIYEKTIGAWKRKAEQAFTAAAKVFKE